MQSYCIRINGDFLHYGFLTWHSINSEQIWKFDSYFEAKEFIKEHEIKKATIEKC